MTSQDSSRLVEARVKHLLREVVELSTDGSERLLSVSEYYGVAPRAEVVDAGDHLSRAESLEGYKKCAPGDLVMNIMLAWKRALGVTSYEGIVSPAYAVFRPDSDRISSRFAHYFFRSDLLVSEFKRLSTGVIDSRLRLYPEVFGGMTVQLPPVDQQERIANFLDEQTARIDALIAEKERLTERLTELWGVKLQEFLLGEKFSKQVKCLPNPWVKELPAGWSWAPLKTRLAANDGGVWGDEPTGESDTVVLRSTEQKADGAWEIVEPAKRKISKQEWEACVLKEGDLLVTKSSGSASHIGKTSLVDAEVASLQACYSNFMQRLRVKESALPKFVWYWMNSPLCREQLAYLSTTTSGLSNLNGSVLGSVYLSFPPLPEQEDIVRELDETKRSIDALKRHCIEHIQKLREYRSSLISAAVTGQLDLSTFKAAA